MKKLLAIAFCIPASFAAVAFQVRDVSAACSIAWDVFQPRCDNAAADRSFQYDLGTACVYDGVNQWTLHLAFTPANSFNISNATIFPQSHNVILTQNYFSSHTGTLTSPATCGNFQTSAWDGTNFMCAGAHDVTIRVNGAACTPGC